MSKSTAFLICVACLMAIFFCSILYAESVEEAPVSGIITALVAVTTGYIGLQVTNNGVIGKYYRPELDKNTKHEMPATTWTVGYADVQLEEPDAGEAAKKPGKRESGKGGGNGGV
jgi:hypothetical protein